MSDLSEFIAFPSVEALNEKQEHSWQNALKKVRLEKEEKRREKEQRKKRHRSIDHRTQQTVFFFSFF